MTESQLQEQIAQYLRLQYPNVLFHSDFGSGIKMTKGQAIKQKRQNGGIRGWPDMFIAEPIPKLQNNRFRVFNGLFLELKKDGVRLKKKNDEWASDHIAEQAKMLARLAEKGYRAEFAVGFDEAKRIIDEYLSFDTISNENFN